MSDKTLARARLTATRRWPHATAAILSLVPVEKPGLGTCAVDRHWRLYYDPAFLAKCSPDEAAGVILHEVSHCLLKHADRAQSLVAKNDAGLSKLWNIAADAAINYGLQQEKIDLPKGAVYPSTLKLEGNQSSEWYFAKLKEQAREQSGNGSRKGSGNDGEDSGSGPQAAGGGQPSDEQAAGEAVAPGTSGSCSDGRQRPWEADPPSGDEAQDEAEGTPPGLQQHEQQQIVQQVAEALKSRGTQRGSMWAGFVEEVLNPKVDPRTLLTRLVRRSVDQIVNGSDEWSYRRPARRPGLGGVLRPSGTTIVPKIFCLIDTSGSMGREDLGLACGLVGKVLSGLRLRDGIKVFVGDCELQAEVTIFDPKKIPLKGRGGTDVGGMLKQVYEGAKDKPDLLLAITDGETPWESTPLPVKVVACLTRKPYRMPPSWIQSVVLQ